MRSSSLGPANGSFSVLSVIRALTRVDIVPRPEFIKLRNYRITGFFGRPLSAWDRLYVATLQYDTMGPVNGISTCADWRGDCAVRLDQCR